MQEDTPIRYYMTNVAYGFTGRKQFHVHVSDTAYETIQKAADKEGIKLSSQSRKILDFFIVNFNIEEINALIKLTGGIMNTYSDKRITLYVPMSVFSKFNAIVASIGMNMSKTLRLAIFYYFAKATPSS